MYYRLRMCREDEYHVAYQLYRLAMSSETPTFKSFAINGEQKSVTVGSGAPGGGDKGAVHVSRLLCRVGMWAVMKGGAAEGTMPDVTIDIEFVWASDAKENEAAALLQSAWRACRSRSAAQCVPASCK